MIRLLVVDDSALMRRQLAQVFSDAGGFEIRLAKNGKEAVEENRAFQPDVVTLDINMPEMDGIMALSLIMAQRPVAVIMVSSLTEKGALATFEALNLGAVDYITKPGGTISMGLEDIRQELIQKVRSASTAKLKRAPTKGLVERIKVDRESIRKPMRLLRETSSKGIVVIGASTGGPRTVEEILQQLPSDLPWPVLLAQHMPSAFTKSFADRLNHQCALNVVEAGAPMAVEPGTVYLGRGGGDMILTMRAGVPTVLPKPESPHHLWHPSVELMARSVLEYCLPDRVIAVMLTGMGHDGAEAFTEIKIGGGRVIAESESSAVVFGMPAEVIRRGGATMVLPMEKIASQIIEWIQH